MKSISKYLFLIIMAISLVWTLGGCGGGSGSNDNESDDDNDSAVTVTLSPTETTGNKLAVNIAGTFSAAISEPLSWYNKIKLQKDGAGDNLCSTISYDSTSKRVACAHTDLDENSSYTVTVTGIKDSNGTCVADAAKTFSTAYSTIVDSVEKTSITTTTGGSVDITYNFNTALSSAPTISVNSTDDADVSAGSCVLAGDGRSCTVTISGVSGCNDPTDYAVKLSFGDYEDYEMSFNSADNEFENPAAVTSNDCWETYEYTDVSNYSWSYSSNDLLMSVLTDDSVTNQQMWFDKPFTSNKTGAFAVHIHQLGTLPTTGADLSQKSAGVMAATVDIDDDGNVGNILAWNSVQLGFAGGYNYTGMYTSYSNDGSTVYNGIPTSSGTLGDAIDLTSDLYVCMTAYDDVVTTYISLDGLNYYKVNEDNMECMNGSLNCYLSQIDSRSISSWDNLRLSLWVVSDWTTGDTSFWAKYGFARFRNTGLNGSFADCPMLRH